MAEILENHELRRPGGVPFGPAFFSTDDDRERLRGVGVPAPLVAGAVWPLVCGVPLVLEVLDSADVGWVPAVCWGCAGAGVWMGGDGGLLLTLSVAESVIAARLGDIRGNGGGYRHIRGRRGSRGGRTLWRGLCHPADINAMDLLHAW